MLVMSTHVCLCLTTYPREYFCSSFSLAQLSDCCLLIFLCRACQWSLSNAMSVWPICHSVNCSDFFFVTGTEIYGSSCNYITREEHNMFNLFVTNICKRITLAVNLLPIQHDVCAPDCDISLCFLAYQNVMCSVVSEVFSHLWGFILVRQSHCSHVHRFWLHPILSSSCDVIISFYQWLIFFPFLF